MSNKGQIQAPMAVENPFAVPVAPPKRQNQRKITFATVTAAWASLNQLLDDKTDRYIPPDCWAEPDFIRRARLICRFGFLGALFGAAYALFYLLIGHVWGALIIVICSSSFGVMPWVMKRTGSLNLPGHLLSLTLVLGFSSLCFIEGGMNGHAIAWLASVPLCSLLLLGRRGAGIWAIASFSSCAIIVGLNLSGFHMKPTYDPKWEGLVSAAGYLGFILFMFILGAIFETSRNRAFAQLQDVLSHIETSNAELTKLNREKNEFLGIAAHDLKNPLSVVIGTAELLKQCHDPKVSERMLGNIVGAGTRMLHLVKNLLDANAIEEGRFVSILERNDLQMLARQSVEDNRPSATAKEITLKLETDAPCWGKMDSNAALQILDNFVSNAIKYSPRKTTVHVSTVVVGEKATVFIRDEGPGISEDDQQKLFGKFTRLSARPTGGESSNGLGLSIVKRLAEVMNGTVRCESKLGHGATFILELPVWKETGK